MIRYVFGDEIIPIKNAKNADPQKIGEALKVLSDKSGGRLTPESVEEAARSKNHVLHSFFEWDDTVAARAYRIDQARQIIRLIRVDDADYKEPPRAFLSIRDADGVRYHSLQNVQESAHLQSIVLQAAKRDLESFKKRYKALQDVCFDVAAVVEKIDRRLAKESHADA